MQEYKINVIAGTKVIADMAQSIKDKTINDQRMKAVPPGPLPAGPPDKEMYMELLSEGTWTFNGVAVATNPKSSILNLWWNKSTWNVDDQATLPSTPISERLNQWILTEAYSIISYNEGVYGISNAVIIWPDSVSGNITSIVYDSSGRTSKMDYLYNSIPSISKSLTITYNNNQIQTSIN